MVFEIFYIFRIVIVNFGGTGIFKGGVQFNTGLFAEQSESAFLGAKDREWNGAWIGGIGIATDGVQGGTEDKDRLIEGLTGPLILKGGKNGTVGAGVSIDGQLNVTGLSTFRTDVELVGATAGVTSVTWDSSATSLKFKDGALAQFGDSLD